MAKSMHTRKKARRVRHWAIWLEARGHYHLASDGTVFLYKTYADANSATRWLFYADSEPYQVDHVELRKI